jgi:nicotinate-nucleotide--dimethylbenzimidazole phosphoribosyltransferase
MGRGAGAIGRHELFLKDEWADDFAAWISQLGFRAILIMDRNVRRRKSGFWRFLELPRLASTLGASSRSETSYKSRSSQAYCTGMLHGRIAMTLPTGFLPTSFADIRRLLSALPTGSLSCSAAVRARQEQLTKPLGALGRLEDIAAFLARWQRQDMPTLIQPLVLIFAGNHGVVRRGVSAYPASVTRAMVGNFETGGAAINQICASFGLGLKVVSLDLDHPTEDFTQAPAMDEAACLEAFAAGMAAIVPGTDLLCIGEMGIGNSTAAAAIYYALYGGEAGHWVGRGTGVDALGLACKIDAVEAGIAHHKDWLGDPLEVLRRLGGREIAAMAGAIAAARLAHIPVLLDGYIACAAAALLQAQAPEALDHCLAAHVSGDGAHQDVLTRLGKEPLLDLGLRLGEGSGAALAACLVKAALACHTDMATFAEAQVAGKIKS